MKRRCKFKLSEINIEVYYFDESNNSKELFSLSLDSERCFHIPLEGEKLLILINNEYIDYTVLSTHTVLEPNCKKMIYHVYLEQDLK